MKSETQLIVELINQRCDSINERLDKHEKKLENLSEFKIKLTSIAVFIMIIFKLASPLLEKLF